MDETTNACAARNNGTVSCDGEFMPSEGLCLRHAVLFDVWIANGGHRVYSFNPPETPLAAPTIGARNPVRLRRWKRAQFHRWLDSLSLTDVEQIMEEGA